MTISASVSGRTIAKNAGLLMGAQIITWGLTFVTTIFVSRGLGPTGIGQLELGNALWTIVTVLAALGTDTLLTKEIARSRERLNDLFGTALALRLAIFLISALGMFLYLLFAGYPPLTMTVIWIIGLCFLVGLPANVCDSSLKGLERMEFTSLSSVTFIALLALPRIALLLLGYGVVPVALVGILANLGSLAVLAYFLNRIHPLKLKVNWALMRSVMKSSIPYFLVTVGIVLYHQVDTVIISLLVNEKTIGWYGVADHLYGTLLFIPNVFVTALFPALTRAFSESETSFRKLAQKSMNLLLAASVPIGFGIVIISSQLITLLFGPQFANSGPVLAVRGLVLNLTYMNMLLGFLLVSMDRQKAWAIVMLSAVVATIPLDLILVPWTVRTFANGALGGTLSFIVTEIGMTIAALTLLPHETFSRANIKVAAKLLLAGLVMMGVTWFVRDLFILIPILVGLAVYAVMFFVLRPIPKEDWDFFLNFGNSIFGRIRRRFVRVAEVKG